MKRSPSSKKVRAGRTVSSRRANCEFAPGELSRLSGLFSLCAALLLLPLLTMCQRASVPTQFAEGDSIPAIYPDYVDVTVPVNIAPLTFEWDGNGCDDMVTLFSAGDEQVVCGGLKAQPSMDEWHALTAAALGADAAPARNAITVDVYTQNADRWTHHKPFSIYVSTDSIDPWMSYRLIAPSYVTYEELTLNQRCLENYDERVMVDNMLCGLDKTGQCVNCHNYQQYDPKRMQFHARQHQGGTVIVYNGTVKKVNMKNDSIISAGVYPAWHPWLPLIVYSTNHTGQSFHTRDLNKIEVFDSASDLIVYNVETDEVSNVENDPNEFEVFPAWAPDGRTLYYCSAHFERQDTGSVDVEVIRRAKEIHYALYRKSFDPETRKFGPREQVFPTGSGVYTTELSDVSSDDSSKVTQPSTLNSQLSTASEALTPQQSVTLPRVSPDGRFLMFTMGRYGVFHIWHREADLYLLDLTTGEVRAMDEINSDDTESYHSWSSNGRWVVFSSRRDDGGFTRPFIAHIDEQGRGAKPFELPQRDPDYHRQFMKSYNIPELMRGPVEITPQEFADVLKGSDGVPVKFR